MSLPPEVVELIASLRARDRSASAENAELRRRLGLDSSNSSKPPSSDGLKKKPRIARQPARPFGQAERRAEGPSRATRLRQVANPDVVVRARGLRLRAIAVRLSRPNSAIGGRKAAGVRSSRAPAAGDRTSSLDLPLRALPRRDEGGVSRRRGLAGPIWRAHQGGGDLSQRPATHPRGSRPRRR